MGTFRGCIDEAAAAGEFDEDTAGVAREAYDDAFSAFSETFGTVEADRMAAEATMRRLEGERIEAARRRAVMIRARRSVLEGVAGLKTRRGYQGVQALGGGGGSKPPKDGWIQGGAPPPKGPGSGGAIAARALELLVENKGGLSGGPFSSIEGRYRYLRGQADAMMAGLIEAFETRTGFDRPGRARLENLVREAFGEDTGDLAAKGMAEAWGQTAEWLRHGFNAAGGAIGKLDKWGLPQRWDAAQVRKVGKDAWVAGILPRLNRTAMVDRVTGLPFTDARLKAVLGEVWANIATGGAIKRRPGERLGRGMLAKQRGEERFLVFKSADDWLAAQSEFGEADAFQTMMGHVDDMTRDIAQMQILGPNPDHQFEWLAAFAQREAQIEEAGGVQGASDRARSYVQTARDMLAHFNGDAAAPVNSKLAQAGMTARAWLTGVSLGSAILSDMPSAPMFGAMARSFTGLSRTGDMAEFVRLLASPAERAIARRSGFIIEQATDGFVRATGDNLRLVTVGERADGKANAFARRMPAATMRLQGLTPYVAARKRAFRFEFMGALHDVRGMTLKDLAAGDERDRMLGQWLEARGFDEASWGIIRAAPVWEPRTGAKFLRPMDVADETLAARLGEAIEMETRLVSPETTLWTRAKLMGQSRPGTVSGEARRSWAMFRGFSMTASHLFGEELALRGNRAGGVAMTAGYAAGMLVSLTIAGAVAIQLREIIKGNDPRKMDDARFWGAAMMQGGGLGIFGDFLYAAQARNGLNAQAAAFGPVGQFVGDSFNLTIGNALEIGADLGRGDELGEAVAGARIGRDAADYVGRYTPLATVWWLRTAFSRGVTDNLHRLLDPEAEEAFARRRKRMEREYGQEQWWPQGGAPERAPDLGAALEPTER
mgnify:CR=1 FL=1